jgi:hypothetical protein
MAFTRDTYYAALYAHLQTHTTGVVTWSRRHLAFSKLPAAAQPAVFVVAANQNAYMEPRCPTVWRLGVDVVGWVRATGQEGTLDTVLNTLLDSFEHALMSDSGTPGTLNTLGGLLQSMDFAGPIDINQREGGEEASFVIPLDMTVIGDAPGSG